MNKLQASARVRAANSQRIAQALIAKEGTPGVDPITGTPTDSTRFKTDEHIKLDQQVFPFFSKAVLDSLAKYQTEADYFNYSDAAKERTSKDYQRNGQWQNQYHFDNGKMKDSAASINTYLSDLVEYSNPSTARKNKFVPGKSLGYIAHAIQDFYAHANWVESMVEGKIAPGVLLNLGRGAFPALEPGSDASGLMVMDSVKPGSKTAFGVVQDFYLGNKGEDKREKPRGDLASDTSRGKFWATDMTVEVTVQGKSSAVPGLITATVDPSWYGPSTLDPKISVSHGYGWSTGPLGKNLPLYDPQSTSSGLAKDATPVADQYGSQVTGDTFAWHGLLNMQKIAKFLASEQMRNELSRAYTMVQKKWGKAGADRISKAWTKPLVVPLARPQLSPNASTGEIVIDPKLNQFAASLTAQKITPQTGWDIIDSKGNVRTLKVTQLPDGIIKGFSYKDKTAGNPGRPGYATSKPDVARPDFAAKIYDLSYDGESVATLKFAAGLIKENATYTKSSDRSPKPPVTVTRQVSDERVWLQPRSSSPGSTNAGKVHSLDADPNKKGMQATFNMRLETGDRASYSTLDAGLDQANLGLTRDDLTYKGVFYGLRNISFDVV